MVYSCLQNIILFLFPIGRKLDLLQQEVISGVRTFIYVYDILFVVEALKLLLGFPYSDGDLPKNLPPLHEQTMTPNCIQTYEHPSPLFQLPLGIDITNLGKHWLTIEIQSWEDPVKDRGL